MTPARLVVGGLFLFLTLGLISESVAYDWDQPLLWVPDLVAGLIWCVAGLRFWTVRQAHAALAMGVGVAWFLGNLFPITVFWHRGLLIHLLLVLAFTSRGRVVTGTVVLAYLASLTPVVWHVESTTIALAFLLLLVAAGLSGRPGRTTLARAAQSCLVVTCLVLIVSAATRLATPGPGGASLPTLLAYEVTLAVVGIVLLAAGGADFSDSVVDRVLELEEGPASSLRDALAEVLEDPDLEVGYWRDQSRGYTDLDGHEVVPPEPGSGRLALTIDDDDRKVALVLHDAALQDDPRLAEVVGVATRLATANADLRERAGERREELEASRRRLVRAADDERADVAALLRVGPQARLTRLLDGLRGIPDPPSDLTAATAHVVATLDDLGRWERGLHPRDLEQGLGPALANLAATSRIPVTVSVSGPRVAPEVETAIYYVCAEALANVTKHASADHASVSVAADETVVTFEVTDDGTGAADPDAGTGLRGAHDRIEAFGGTLTITGAAGHGTRLSGAVPLSPER